MPPTSLITNSIYIAIGLLGLGVILAILGRRQEAVISLVLFLGACFVFYVARATMKQFFPFTDKIEAFVSLSVFLVMCTLIYRNRLSGREFVTLLLLSLAATSAVFIFTDIIRFTPIYLNTFWYPLHVPLSFAAYAFWFVAGVNALYNLSSGHGAEPAASEKTLMTDLNRNGFIVFTLAMLFGGIWGYLAWGAYFMWDPKLIWSAILWLFYGNLLHIDYLPRLRRWKAPLYVLGMALMLITFIGTSFFARSIHRFGS